VRAAILCLSALVLVAAASAGTRPDVTLAVAPGAALNVGTTVQLTARAALATGARLSIRRAPSGTSVAVCGRSPCTGSYTGRATGTVGFQAVVTRGGSTVARSRTVAVRFAQSAPPPGAVPGVYEGRTSQNELFRFEITSDGRGLVHLETGKFNESCLGPAGDRPSIRRGDIGPLAQTFPVAADGSFTIRLSGSAESNGALGSYELAIDGRVASGAATGTFREDVVVGVYECTSGDQSWTAAPA